MTHVSLDKWTMEAMIFEYIFNFGNLFVLPFWALMVLLPNWDVTRKIMASYSNYKFKM
ncbi:abscisic acid-deficient protein Aba4 family protein [Leptothoe sp. PORK10 BA2]|nr:abscisic acid-deficient protein Aba4 family protein [Leptothoe sp. PORK10 BA2]MEA5464963.1 abscisic acid-deficient protein Aba4 family protein [Leptothoe sp. PORK10 BA2]